MERDHVFTPERARLDFTKLSSEGSIATTIYLSSGVSL